MKLKYKLIVVLCIVLALAYGYYDYAIKTKFTMQLPEQTEFTYTPVETIVGSQLTGDEEPIKVTEKNGVSLYIDPLTTNVILKNSENEIITETLPGLKSKDKSVQGALLTPMNVSYKLNDFTAPLTVSVYDESILKQSYIIDMLDQGVMVSYSMGQSGITQEMIPPVIEKDMYENQIEPALDERQKAKLGSHYTYRSTKEVYEKGGKIKPSSLVEMYNYIYVLGGYTEEDLANSYEKYDIKPEEETEPIGGTVSIIYNLDDDGNLNVQIPLEKIEVSGINQVVSIDVLPGLLSTRNGHFLVPDGSGAIVDTTSAKASNIYTKDFTNLNNEIVGNYNDLVTENLTLPLFANDNIIAFINSGAVSATLHVELNGKSKLIYPSINTQYSSFYSFSNDKETAGLNLTSDQITGTFDITYKIYEQKQTIYDYVKTTREYYINKYNLSEEPISPSMYLYVIGGFDFTDYMLGVPYTNFDTLTTSEDIMMISEELSKIENLKFIYDGWNQNGINSSLENTKPLKANGDVEKLVSDNENISLALNLVRVSTKFSDGYNPKVDGAYGVFGEPTMLLNILNSSFEEDDNSDEYFYLSPAYLQSAIDNFVTDFELSKNIFIKDLSKLGYASFKSNESVMPLEAEQLIADVITTLKENDFNIGMNNPAIDRGFRADYIVNVPTDSSEHNVFDYSVPFVQLVYSDIIDYTNTAINLSPDGNIQKQVMRAMETKSSLLFTIGVNQVSKLKGTNFDQYYSIDYTRLKDTIIDINDEYDKFLSEINNEPITNFEIIDDGAEVVTYGDEVKVIFNYSDDEVTYEGTQVKPNSYKIMEGE